MNPQARAMPDPIPMEPQPPGRPADRRAQAPTIPCPGCGWPVAADAVLCVRCGQRVRGDAQLATRMDKAEELAALPPAVGSIRWRNEGVNDYSLAREMLKPTIWLAIGLTATLLLRAHMPGPEDVLPHLGRFGILVGGSLVLWVAARFIYLDQEVTVVTVILGIAAALACSDAIQHVVRYATPVALTAWPIGLVLCVGLLSDLLDMEVTEAAFLGVVFYGLKIMLKISLFTTFLPPP
ncbi:MAG: hypothetical protein ACKVU4_05495 [Phycisphaerales bacterium]